VIIKPLHPKLAHAFGYRLSLSASVHTQTWPVIDTVTKRALFSSSLPVPRSKADENSNHNHLIIEENSFTVQLTFSDGNCSSSIYLLAFYLCFVSKTLSFCLQISCIHVCWSYCFLWHLVTQSSYDNRNVIINWVSYRTPTAHFCFTAPLEFFTAPGGRYRPLWEPLLYIISLQCRGITFCGRIYCHHIVCRIKFVNFSAGGFPMPVVSEYLAVTFLSLSWKHILTRNGEKKVILLLFLCDTEPWLACVNGSGWFKFSD